MKAFVQNLSGKYVCIKTGLPYFYVYGFNARIKAGMHRRHIRFIALVKTCTHRNAQNATCACWQNPFEVGKDVFMKCQSFHRK